MPRRTIAIGDIHGCFAAFQALLEMLHVQRDDRLILLGDYVDRGPQSRQVMDKLLELGELCELVPLLGNHELMMLQAFDEPAQAQFWLYCGGQATLDSYGGAPDLVPAEHIDFLRRCLPFYETRHHFFVHANYDSSLPLAEQPPDLLYWVHLYDHCPLPHLSGKTAVLGHTPQRDGQVLRLDGVICLDTFCVGDGWLTALDIDRGDLWQVDRLGNARTTGPKNINDVPLH